MFLSLKHIQNEGPIQDLEIDPKKSLIPPTPSRSDLAEFVNTHKKTDNKQLNASKTL